MMWQSKNTAVLLLVASVMVSGCAGKTIKLVDPAAVKNYVTSVEQAQQAKLPAKRYRGRLEPVGIPQNALWLGHARTPHFKHGKAQILIRALVAPHPVVFNVDTDDNPVVSVPPSAVILKDYFDSFATQSNWVYRVNRGVVIFEDWETRSIELAPLVGTAEAILESYAAAGVVAQDNKLTVSTDPYTEIESIVTDILSNETATANRQATFAVSRSANTLFISAQPNQVRKVVNAIETFNKSVSKRVIFDVTVYDVSLSGGDNRSLDLDLLRATAGHISVRGGGDGLSVGRAGVDTTQTSIDSLVLNWIQSQGAVSKRIQRRFEVLNNHTATFLDTIEIAFLESVVIPAPVDGVPQAPGIEIGKHGIGRSFNLFATITGLRVNVQMNVNERSIAATKNYTLVGGSGGTLYDILNRDRVISLSLEDGETRILTYFQGDDAEEAHSQNRFLPLLGDKVADTSEKTESVIVISAAIVD